MNPVINFDEWQFVHNQSQMSFPLNPAGGTEIDIWLFSDKKVHVLLVNSVTDDQLQLTEGEHINIIYKTLGFDSLVVKAPNRSDYAIKLLVTNDLSSEANDGETQQILTPDELPDLRINREIQQRVIQELAGAGFSGSDIQDIIDGLNSNEFDLEFEDDDDLPTEAEMNDMIDSARVHASEQDQDTPDAPSEPPEDPKPPADDPAPTND